MLKNKIVESSKLPQIQKKITPENNFASELINFSMFREYFCNNTVAEIKHNQTAPIFPMIYIRAAFIDTIPVEPILEKIYRFLYLFWRHELMNFGSLDCTYSGRKLSNRRYLIELNLALNSDFSIIFNELQAGGWKYDKKWD